MDNKDNNYNLLKNTFVLEGEHLQEGQRIVYEGEEAEVVKVTPFLVVKTKNGVVCGALNKRVELCKGEKNLWFR